MHQRLSVPVKDNTSEVGGSCEDTMKRSHCSCRRLSPIKAKFKLLLQEVLDCEEENSQPGPEDVINYIEI